MRNSAGRANCSKATITDTGLPGRPKKGVRPSRPKAKGLAGCIATCQNSMSPNSASTALTRSYSPMDTPPEVKTASASSPALARVSRSSAASSGTIP